MADTILKMSNIYKDFGHVQALDNVDFELASGEVHALLGMNGAGKSTLTKILSGIYEKTSGEIVIDGKEVSLGDPEAAQEVGIAAVQQHPELVLSMTGYENILLGREADEPGLFRKIDRKALKKKAKSLLARFPLSIDLDRKVSELSAVEREVLAILHALTQDDIRILLLDEPTSTLTENEQELLFSLMRSLRDDGISILYITHRLEEVFQIADRFTIFRNGKHILTMEAEEARRTGASLAEMMLGQPLKDLYPDRIPVAELGDDGEAVVEVENLTLNREFEKVSFKVRKGEILGIFGLVGSGVHQLSDALFGVKRPNSGSIRLHGEEVDIKSPGVALKKGIFLLPGDRRSQGLVMERNSIFNITLTNLKRSSNILGLNRMKYNRAKTEEMAERLDLTPSNVTVAAGSFSGGNQQKIVIGKGLFSEANVYIFVEPTIGVDVGARAKIYTLMRDLAKDSAVIVISSDCDEVHGLGDRVMAIYKGRPVSEPVPVSTRDSLFVEGVMGEIRN